MFNRLVKIFALLFAGFVGGAMSPWIIGWINRAKVEATGDAISIANTYIVFTTIIFVGVTVILAVAGYVFTQQFSASKGAQEREILDELKVKIKEDEKAGISLANAILENNDVRRHLEKKISEKVDELIRSTVDAQEQFAEEMQASAKSAQNGAEALRSLASQLNGNGKGGS